MLTPDLSDTPAVGPRALRQFAAIWLAIFGGLAAWNLYEGDAARALVLGVLAAAVGPVGLARPGAIRWVYSLAVAVTRPVGVILTRILLAIMFYFMFTPLALVFRLLGRDVLGLKRRAGATTFWIRRQAATDIRRYLRQ